ncbi:MAG: roadblock/LC7 domain-containing protein [Candidatus Odinarchaeota archaeon]
MSDEYMLPQILDRTVKRLSAREGVLGILIIDKDGLVLRSNMPPDDAERIAGYVSSMVTKVYRVIDNIDQVGELASIFIEIPKKEVIVTPDLDAGFTIIVLKERP